MNFDDYKYDSDANDYLEAHEFVVTQERTILVQYTVEATSLSNAVAQIEAGDYSGVIEEDASHAVTDKTGRIVSARVNDNDN